MDTQVDPRDEMPLSPLVFMTAEWDGWDMTNWPSRKGSHVVWTPTFKSTLSEDTRTWRLVKWNLTEQQVIEEWECEAK